MNMAHLFTTNVSVDAHNNSLYILSKANKAQIKAVDIIVRDMFDDLKNQIKNKISDYTTKAIGLYLLVLVATVAKYDLITNIDVTDRFTNGVECVIEYIDYRVENSSRRSIILVSFPYLDIGRNQRRENAHLYRATINKNWTPVLEVERQFRVNKKCQVQISLRKFPLRLGAAKTIYCCQGDRLNEAVVDFPLSIREYMHYVHFRRV